MKDNQSSLAIKYFLDNFPLDVMINKVKSSNKKEEFDSYSEGEKLNIIYQTPGKKLGSDAIKIVSIEKIK